MALTLALTVAERMLMMVETLAFMLVESQASIVETVLMVELQRVEGLRAMRREALAFMAQREEVGAIGKICQLSKSNIYMLKYGFMAINFSNLHIIQSCLN